VALRAGWRPRRGLRATSTLDRRTRPCSDSSRRGASVGQLARGSAVQPVPRKDEIAIGLEMAATFDNIAVRTCDDRAIDDSVAERARHDGVGGSPMDAGSNAIREFFRQYARSRNTFDPDLIASQYPESWMFAGPDGVRVAVKADLLAGLAKGKEWLRTLGHTSTTLTSMEESRWMSTTPWSRPDSCGVLTNAPPSRLTSPSIPPSSSTPGMGHRRSSFSTSMKTSNRRSARAGGYRHRYSREFRHILQPCAATCSGG
jgi:hypothetical protein